MRAITTGKWDPRRIAPVPLGRDAHSAAGGVSSQQTPAECHTRDRESNPERKRRGSLIQKTGDVEDGRWVRQQGEIETMPEIEHR